MPPRPPASPLSPYTTLFRSDWRSVVRRRSPDARFQVAIRVMKSRKGCARTARLHDADRDLEPRSEEHTSELQSHVNVVCRLLLEKKNANEDTEPAHRRQQVV